MVLMGYSGAQGTLRTLIYEKNLKAKISCQTPFQLSQLNEVAIGPPDWTRFQPTVHTVSRLSLYLQTF
jgi:hypothetical protein